MSRRREQRPIPAARCGTQSVLAALPLPLRKPTTTQTRARHASIQVPCNTIGGSGSRSSNVGPSMSDKTLAAVFRQPEAPMACSSRTSIGAYLTPLLVSNLFSDIQRERGNKVPRVNVGAICWVRIVNFHQQVQLLSNSRFARARVSGGRRYQARR